MTKMTAINNPDLVYYKEKKLSGQPIESNIINIELFNFIFEHTSTNKFELEEEEETSSFFGMIKTTKKVFGYIQLMRDGVEYNTNEGNFYLPNSIAFYDVGDYDFPSAFYFIAKIGNQIELRKCNGGEGVKWFQIPDLHRPVIDAKLVSKIENSLIAVKKLVETDIDKRLNTELNKQKLAKKQLAEANKPLLSTAQMQAYIELTTLCIRNNPAKESVIAFIETLKTYKKNNNRGYTALDYFTDFLDEERINFIIKLDWKAGIEDLEGLLQASLKDNYDLAIKLPKAQDYPEETAISDGNVFEDFDRPLRAQGLQLGFIDTGYDEYLVFLHQTRDMETVRTAVKKISYGNGYKYHEA